jgi:hypothetical protein
MSQSFVMLQYDGRSHRQRRKIFLVVKLNLFTFETITLLESKILNATIFGVEIGTKELTFNFPHFEG